MQTVVRRLLSVLLAALPVSLLLVVVPSVTAPAGAVTVVDGPDVSSHQHPGGAGIDWSKVRANGREFGFVKATEGSGYANPYFARDYAGLKSAGMIRGAYHFARPSGGATNARAQARYFVAHAGTLTGPGELPPVLDLEVTGGLGPSALVSWTHAYVDEVQRLTGRKPMIYTYPSFWRNAMGNTTAFTGYPLWIATYSSAPQLVGGWTRYTFWQYTDRASISGISGGVDNSVFAGTPTALSALARTAVRPGAPTKVAASSTGTTATLAWAPPTTGSTAAGYRVSVDGRQVAQVAGATTKYTATGLVPGGHQLSVLAYNAAGTGPAASAAAVVIVKPGAPTALRLGVSGTTITAAWSPPSANPGELLGYHVSVDGGAPATVAASTASYAAPNLRPGPHTVAVTAYNRLGDGPAASSAATVIVKPAAPSNLMLSVVGTSITAAWGAPATDPGQLTGYRVRLDGGAPVTLPAATTTHTFSSLAPGPHTVSVLAYNSVGDGDAGSAVAAVIITPTSPTGLRTSVASGVVTATWSPPVQIGGELSGYLLQVDGTAPLHVSADVTTQTLTGLTPGKHRIAVAAYNSAGISRQVATFALVVFAPDAPTAVSAVTKLGTSTLTWSAPADIRGELSGYLVWVDGGSPVALPTTTTHFAATHLTPGPHVLEVAAFNTAGSSAPVMQQVNVVLLSSAPTALAAAGRAGGNVDVTWAAPSAPGGPLSGYRVGLDGKLVAQVAATALKTTLRGVAVGKHTVTVTAWNAAGTGATATRSVTVLPTPTVSALLSAARVKPGAAFSVSGATSRAFAGQWVHLQVWRSNAWYEVTHTTVSSTGHYVLTAHGVSKATTTSYRVAMAANATHYAAHSGTVSLRTG